MREDEVFAAIGEEGFRRLIAAFYEQVPGDPVLGPMYPDGDFAGAEKRLRDFLIYRFGGPANYIEERGHPRLRMRHAPFAVDLTARQHWLKMMRHALEVTDIPQAAKDTLWPFFEGVATAMLNRE